MSQTEHQFTQLVQKLAPQGKLLDIRPLSGGMSAHMTAFELEDAAGQRQKLIWRSYQQGQACATPMAREFRLLQMTQSVGLNTPAPYYLDLSGEIFAQLYLVIEYMEGHMLFAPPDLAHYLRQLAAQLAQIHAADYTKHDLSFLPKVANCVEIERERPLLLTTLREDHIRHLLAQWPSLPRNPATLLHGDFWPGNSLWLEDKLVGVIDWEDAKWGDPLLDLAISRLDIAWIFGMAATHTFTQHYQAQVAWDYTHLPYWDLCAALRFMRIFGNDLAAAGTYFVPFGRDDINEQMIRENFNYFVDQALANVPY